MPAPKKTIKKKVKVVVFDFDGTLSGGDANSMFLKYCMRHSVRPWLFLPFTFPVAYITYKINKYSNWARDLLRSYMTPKMIKKLTPGFIAEHKRERFGWSRDQVIAEKKKGNIVILISAGADYLIPKLVDDIPFDSIICSTFDPKHPGKLKFFCYGDNKVVALNAWAKYYKVTPHVVRSYSDSKTDIPIMKLADEEVWIDPKTGTRREA